jgi:hypothetical protein
MGEPLMGDMMVWREGAVFEMEHWFLCSLDFFLS